MGLWLGKNWVCGLVNRTVTLLVGQSMNEQDGEKIGTSPALSPEDQHVKQKQKIQWAPGCIVSNNHKERTSKRCKCVDLATWSLVFLWLCPNLFTCTTQPRQTMRGHLKLQPESIPGLLPRPQHEVPTT